MATDEPREVLFGGRVEGVGFRMTTLEISRGRPITGFVRNLPDGQVQLVAEGKPEDLDQFIDAVHGVFARYIEGLDVTKRPAEGRFTTFEIRS